MAAPGGVLLITMVAVFAAAGLVAVGVVLGPTAAGLAALGLFSKLVLGGARLVFGELCGWTLAIGCATASAGFSGNVRFIARPTKITAINRRTAAGILRF